MKILHYTLGLPPHRSGGLVKYALDLALEQSKNNEVILLYPGINTRVGKVSIEYKKKIENIQVYFIKNPLPLSIMDGIKNPEDFIVSTKLDEFEKFLKREKPDVVHIHTLMGLYKEFLEICKKLGIKIVFTTHDYFGICPRVNLVDYKMENCKDYVNGKKCVYCNYLSPSIKKQKQLNSYLYVKMRESLIVNKFKGIIKKILSLKVTSQNGEYNISENELNNKGNEYKQLRNYYLSLFKLVDSFHFNSNISKEIYCNYLLPLVEGKVIYITHGDIKNNFHSKKIECDKIRISFLGNENPIKGLPILLEAFKNIDRNYKEKIELNIYGVEDKIIKKSKENIFFKGKYKYSELEKIFQNTDYTIVPSIWYETFNFVALESKINKTPVIISNTVGAKDLFGEHEKIEFEPKIENLKKILENICSKMTIKKFEWKSMEKHSKEIIQELYKW